MEIASVNVALQSIGDGAPVKTLWWHCGFQPLKITWACLPQHRFSTDISINRKFAGSYHSTVYQKHLSKRQGCESYLSISFWPTVFDLTIEKK